MSQDAALFVIVEGKRVDQWFYEKMCARSPKAAKFGHKVWRIESFKLAANAAPTGGKSAIYGLYYEMKSLNSLKLSTHNGTRAVMFCVDADYEHLARTVIRSPHITYTQLPDAEAHVLDTCDLAHVVSASMSLTRDQTATVLKQIGDYRAVLAANWLEWLIVCCLHDVIGAARGPRSGTPPPAPGDAKYGRVNTVTVAKARRAVVQSSTLTKAEIATAESRIRADFVAALSSGEGRRLLKGKWLAAYLRSGLNKYAEKNDLYKLRRDEELIASACTCAGLGDPWLRFFRGRVNRIL